MKQKHIRTNNANYRLRREQHQGRPHLVVPVVMMREGVHSGNRGPILHQAIELGRHVASWNGIPVTVSHPADERGNHVSANSPQNVEQAVGRIYNSHMRDDRLCAEAWLDEEKLRQESPRAYAAVLDGRPLDVSVGVFTDDELLSGEFNGETYDAVAHNYRPDHLALLPDERGACSWEDGCGVRVNKKGGDVKKFHDAIKTAAREGALAMLLTQEPGYDDVMNALQMKLDALDSDLRIHWLVKVYDDDFIYQVQNRETNEATMYRRGYTAAEDGSVEFADEDPVEVRQVVEFVAANAAPMRRNKFNHKKKEDSEMSTSKKTPCCEDAIDALIANADTSYSADDKEWLMELPQDRVEKLVANAAKAKAPAKPTDTREESTTNDDPPQINAEQALNAVRDSIKKPEDFFKLLPADMADSMKSGLALHREQRANMVKDILANAEGVWVEDDLNAMDTDTLTKVHKTIPRKTDYSLSGDAGGERPANHTQDDGEPVVEVPVAYANTKDEKGGKS